MAFKHIATLLAEGASLDAFTGRLTTFNMMEAIYAASFPAVLGKLVVVNLYEIEGEQTPPYWEQVRVLTPDGEQVAQAGSELNGQGLTHRSICMLRGVKLSAPGVYGVVVEKSNRPGGPWETVASRRLYVEHQPHPLAQPDEKNPNAGKIVGPVGLTD